jgi:NTE family protein
VSDGIADIGLRRSVALVLAGGAALGAYEAGAYAALHEHVALRPEWLAGSSIGAVNAAIIAGNPPARRVERLRQFWDTMAGSPYPITSFWLGYPDAGPWRQAQNEKSVLDALVFGRPGLFRPRLAPGRQAGAQDVRALFDLAPLREQLNQIVDFELLNRGKVRVSLSCTDVTSGDRVVFDTRHGDRIGADHVLASSALLPLFAPVEVEGRLLADGGFGANTPVDLVLDDNPNQEMLCFVVELFARQGSRPHTLPASANRALDLAFGNQTRRILEGRQREYRLRGLIGQLAERLPAEVREDPEVAAILAEGRTNRTTVVTIAYRAGLDEAGLFKLLDFSRATLTDRWGAGEAAMRDAAAVVGTIPHDAARPALAVIDA